LKQLFNRFFNFLLFGNVYIAVAACCLVQSTLIQLQIPSHLTAYSLLVFFSTLLIYNFQRIFYTPQQNKQLHSIRRNWIFAHPFVIKLLALTGAVGVAITFFYIDFQVFFYLTPLLLLSLAYFAPFIRIRKNAYFKLLTLVTVWTLVTAVVPMLLMHLLILDPKNLLHLLIRFCFMIAICIPFDLRDLHIDTADHISTIPQLLGEHKTRWLAFAFMIIYNALILLSYALNFLPVTIFIALLLSAIVNTWLVWMSRSTRSEYFFVAGIDGTMILQGVLLLGAVYL
jgi:4-hydroxybenzoate polyprenyltransferase